MIFSAQYFSTSTPILDTLRPLSNQQRDRLSAGDCFLISSAMMLVFVKLGAIRTFIDLFAGQPVALLCAGLFVPLFALMAAVAVHEAGHGLAGKLNGFRTTEIKIGPFMLHGSQSTQNLRAQQILPLGVTSMVPLFAERLRRRLFFVVLAGPMANFLVPLLLESAFRMARNGMDPSLQPTTRLLPAVLHLFSAFSVLLGLSSLLPDMTANGSFSDGARLHMLLKHDARAARWFAIVELQLALHRGEHPRGWSEPLVAQAVGLKDESLDAVMAHWLAYVYYVCRHDVTLATKYLEDALALLGSANSPMRDSLFLEAAVLQAWFRHNSLKARFWASEIHDRRFLSPVQRLRLEVALLWAEGKLLDAWEKLGDYLRTIREMPPSPLRDLAEQGAIEWKEQMEPRMLAGAWAALHSHSQQQVASSTAAVAQGLAGVSSW
ncbi:MAG TPA: M50 family metallopeptidase [Candidatus Angelobacter sp.]|nr:M50 family metallopeptidase [Candidatus Angelobacter sp.]